MKESLTFLCGTKLPSYNVYSALWDSLPNILDKVLSWLNVFLAAQKKQELTLPAHLEARVVAFQDIHT